jgi:hypothetical protein
MKKYILAVLFFMFLPMHALASNDLNGYGKSIWGMSPSEVLSAEGPRASVVSPPMKYVDSLGMVSIDNVVIGTDNFSVVFIFTDNKLTQVNVESEETRKDFKNEMVFKNTESLLTQKYGIPTYKEHGKNVVWTLNKTTVELKDIMNQILVKYTPSSTVEAAASNL